MSALFVSLAIGWLLPPSRAAHRPALAPLALAAALAFAPVFFANLCFTASFRDTTTADMSFASNLLGAVVGGALEYAALITGYQQLVWLVALLYLGAYAAATWFPRLADRDLAIPSPLVDAAVAET